VVLRTCTKIGFVYFLAAFAARPLDDYLHHPATRWLVANRRYLGLSFAAWHLQHLWILPAIAWFDAPDAIWARRAENPPAGYVVLFAIVVMTATSFDGAQRVLGRAWPIVHTVGAYLIWIYFMRTYVERWYHRREVYVTIYIALAVLALALRWAAWF